MKFFGSGRILMVALVAGLAGCGGSSSSSGGDLVGGPAPLCQLTEEQLSNPSLATQVPGGLDANLCDFGVFAWESFLHLTTSVGTSPRSLPNSGRRRFQVQADYPEYSDEPGVSCASLNDNIFNAVRVAAPGVGPEAGAGTIYSVEGQRNSGNNVILYNIRFSRSLCSAEGEQLPPDLVEMKLAWRFLRQADRSRYYWQEIRFEDGSVATLGLVGFHLAQVTEYHPEMVWSTWEHVDNAPDCSPTEVSPAEPENGWTMMESECAACLADPSQQECSDPCGPVNRSNAGSGDPKVYPLQADPTNTCRVYPEGTRDGDNQADTNRSNIRQLNAQVAGPDGYLASLPANDPQSVWQNYRLVGGIWFNTATNDSPPSYLPPAPGTNPDRQRGSIALANTVMETTFQGGPVPKVDDASNSEVNCFQCHQAPNYAATMDASSSLSHIAQSIVGGATSP